MNEDDENNESDKNENITCIIMYRAAIAAKNWLVLTYEKMELYLWYLAFLKKVLFFSSHY